MVIRLASYVLIISLIILPSSGVGTTAQSSDPSRQNVVWTNAVNCTVSGSTIEKTAGRDDTSDAAARSQQIISSGAAYVEFSVAEQNKTLFCGLTHSAIGMDYREIDFSIKLTSYSYAEVRENNDYRAETPYRVGDVFRIVADGNVVSYFKNDGLIYTSLKAPAFPLFVQANFIGLGSRIDNAVIGAGAITPNAEWPMYQQNSAHTGISAGSLINASNASTLTQAWKFETRGWVTGTPVVSGGVVYVGSFDSKMYALRESDGSQIWSFTTETCSDNCGLTYGIDGTAALANGKLYFGSAACKMYAVDAATGNPIWRTDLDDPTKGFHLWSSPLVSDGKVYVGLASHCDHPCVRGRVVCLDASNGRVLWQFYTAPDGSTGAGVWSSFAIDPHRRVVYATSGNFCEGNDTYGDSFIALNADTGQLVWSYKNLARDRDVENLDFGASPTLFDIAPIEALAAGSKDGHVYALNRATGELIWDTQITDGSSTGGTISSPAAAYGMIFMGASVQGRTGKVVALDQRTGRIVWEAAQPGIVVGAAAVAGGAVFIGGTDGSIRAYDASNGALLWSEHRATFYGGVSISGTKVLTGCTDNSLYAFSLATTPPPPPPTKLTIAAISPSSGDVWQVRSKYDITWTAAPGVTNVDVSISRDSGATWTTLASGVDAKTGTIRVKAKKPRSETVLVRITDSADQSVSAISGVFRIR
jgi:outer membrane protein assembly factor BamB